MNVSLVSLCASALGLVGGVSLLGLGLMRKRQWWLSAALLGLVAAELALAFWSVWYQHGAFSLALVLRTALVTETGAESDGLRPLAVTVLLLAALVLWFWWRTRPARFDVLVLLCGLQLAGLGSLITLAAARGLVAERNDEQQAALRARAISAVLEGAALGKRSLAVHTERCGPACLRADVEPTALRGLFFVAVRNPGFRDSYPASCLVNDEQAWCGGYAETDGLAAAVRSYHLGSQPGQLASGELVQLVAKALMFNLDSRTTAVVRHGKEGTAVRFAEHVFTMGAGYVTREVAVTLRTDDSVSLELGPTTP